MRWDRCAAAVGTMLFLDALRVFLPSLITLFGRAGETGPEVMGLYALAWFLLPLPLAALSRRLPPLPVALAAGAALALARLALQAADGGDPQLHLASLAVGAGTVWLTATASAASADPRLSGHGVMVGVVAGTAGSAVLHTLLGLRSPAWQEGFLPWLLVAAGAALFLVSLDRVRRSDPGGAPAPVPARAWLALGPLFFLGGLCTANPAVGETMGGFPVGAAVVATAAVLSVGVAADPRPTLHRALPPAVLTAALAAMRWAPTEVDGVPGVLPPAALAVLPVGQIALAACVGWAAYGGGGGTGRVASAWYAFAGLLCFVVLVFAYYAAFDLYFSHAFVPFLALLPLVAALVRARPPASEPPGGRGRSPGRFPPPGKDTAGSAPVRLGAAVGAAGITLAATLAVPVLHTASEPAPAPDAGRGEGLRLAAYNVRMGFDTEGRHALHQQARLLRAERPDLVALSEVDRGWLLNGGHDMLGSLARELDMEAHWAPADGPLWGDAVLTRLEVVERRGFPLTPSGPTGAQALEAVVLWKGREISVVATHLQPDDYGFASESSRSQLRDIARIVTGAREEGRPAVVAGDLNIEPGNPAWHILEEAGLRDPFERPFPTIPTAAGPPREIDHILVTPEFTASAPANPDEPWSDHRMIALTLDL